MFYRTWRSIVSQLGWSGDDAIWPLLSAFPPLLSLGFWGVFVVMVGAAFMHIRFTTLVQLNYCILSLLSSEAGVFLFSSVTGCVFSCIVFCLRLLGTICSWPMFMHDIACCDINMYHAGMVKKVRSSKVWVYFMQLWCVDLYKNV